MMRRMSRLSVRTYHPGVWCEPATDTAVKPVRKLDLRRLRLRASVTMEHTRLPHEEQ
jgi:hypothetical protein